MKKNKNIKAFPSKEIKGMTLRDYFAVRVMEGVISLGTLKNKKEVCQFSYSVADMMLKERLK
jgi:hypothetical protein